LPGYQILTFAGAPAALPAPGGGYEEAPLDAAAAGGIDADIRVLKAVAEAWQSFGPSRVPLGPSAVVRLAGTEVDVILNTNRTQTFEPDIFTNLGIDPFAKDLLLVKSTNHFHAGFAPIAAGIVYVTAPSSYPSDPRLTDYKRLTRPLWPRVADPFADPGLAGGTLNRPA